MEVLSREDTLRRMSGLLIFLATKAHRVRVEALSVLDSSAEANRISREDPS